MWYVRQGFLLLSALRAKSQKKPLPPHYTHILQHVAPNYFKKRGEPSSYNP